MRTATPGGRSLLLRASCVEHATPATQRNVARGVSGHCVVHCTQLRRDAVSTSPLLPLVAAHPVIRDMHHVAVGASSVLPAAALLVAVESARRTAVRMENAALGKGGAVCAQRRCHDAHHRQDGGVERAATWLRVKILSMRSHANHEVCAGSCAGRDTQALCTSTPML